MAVITRVSRRFGSGRDMVGVDVRLGIAMAPALGGRKAVTRRVRAVCVELLVWDVGMSWGRLARGRQAARQA